MANVFSIGSSPASAVAQKGSSFIDGEEQTQQAA
jgi:hypothetical protein